MIQATKDTYAGTWSVDAPDGTVVQIVGSVRPASDAISPLKAVFPFALCIVEVQFSARDLEAALARVEDVRSEWQAEIDWPKNRVVVRLPVIDAEAATALASEEFLPLPLVEAAEP